MIIKLTVLGITLIYVLLLLISDIISYREIKKAFTCKYCNNLNNQLHNGKKCDICGKVYSNYYNKWDYRVLFKITYIDTNIKKVVYNYKDIRKNALKEILIYSIFVIIIISSIIITII